MAWKDLPRDLVDEVLARVEDIDTRIALGVKPRRIDTAAIAVFATLFAAMPRPVVTLYTASVDMGPLRPTYYAYPNPSDADDYRRRPMYSICRYAAGCVMFDDFYLENVGHVKALDEPPGDGENAMEFISSTPDEERYLCDEWDGTLEHYNASCYKVRLNVRGVPGWVR